LKSAVDINSISIEVYLLRANIHALQQKWPLVIEDVNIVLDREPQNIRALILRAQAYMEIGNYEQTLQDLKNMEKFTDAAEISS